MVHRHDLVIVDATLRDFGGHAYIYDTTVGEAAYKYFDGVQIYAHPAFFAHCSEPGLKALKLPPGYRALERTKARVNVAASAGVSASGLGARVRNPLKRAAKMFGALFYLSHVLREGLGAAQRPVVFLQSILKKKLQFNALIYTWLQILSVSVFERTRRSCTLQVGNAGIELLTDSNQLIPLNSVVFHRED